MAICIYFFLTVNRDEAQNKMLALKEKADKEMSQYNTELKELARIIDDDRKLRQFMSRKDQERTEAHEEMEAMKRKREAEKSSEREGTVMVSPRWSCGLILWCGLLNLICIQDFQDIVLYHTCSKDPLHVIVMMDIPYGG